MSSMKQHNRLAAQRNRAGYQFASRNVLERIIERCLVPIQPGEVPSAYHIRERRFLDRILSQLSIADLLSVRLTSKRLNAWTNKCNSAIFQRLYMSPLYALKGRHQSLTGLETVGKMCRELVIKLDDSQCNEPESASAVLSDHETIHVFLESNIHAPRERENSIHSPKGTTLSHSPDISPKSLVPLSRPPRSSSQQHQRIEDSDWAKVFRAVPCIQTLTISAPKAIDSFGSPATTVLTACRIAFDSALLPFMTTLCLDPLPCSYLLFLRWHGFEALGSASRLARRSWSRITHLNIHLVEPPSDIKKKRLQQQYKVLHCWLKSFEDTLQVLEFEWVERRGPDPMELVRLEWVKLQTPPFKWRGGLKTYVFNGQSMDM